MKFLFYTLFYFIGIPIATAFAAMVFINFVLSIGVRLHA